ncbi:hypothetical protein [Aporhodopirellula aestuarii]|uniref:Uncharacterized protein n=1 Tax=Aporhodopirellula aestuarii TaxID=2950107 RepID=A0ABT0U1J0_9BACT|nr:hypothetical protein [Aporhodopirellula aestuarii]MCM2370420.1 hypothetical protein [Aporhodopirellula aestuarii]
MNLALKIVSAVAIALVTIPSVLYFTGTMAPETVKTIALVGTVVWFIATPLWMGRELPIDADNIEI